jgi:hypothetical protein
MGSYMNKPAWTLMAALFILLLTATAASPVTYTLTTAPDPLQGGLVSPNCSAGCLYDGGAVVKLFALPFDGYIFGNWSGDCAGSNPAASVSMTADRSCTANYLYCGGLPVEIGSVGYSGLSAAYEVASDGDTMKMLASNLQESPDLNRQVEITLEGGYGCGFDSNPSMTLLKGPLTVGKGSVTVENLIIVGPLSAATAIPPAIPTLPDATGFDKIINFPAVTGNATQEATGTTGSDRITQYGGTGTVVQTATGDAGKDWILQICGGTSCDQTVNSGDGIDTVYQFGGPGTTSQFIDGLSGDKTYVQVGGASPNTQIAFGSTGLDRIFQHGGVVNDLQSAEGTAGDDHIEQYGQGGNDTMVIEGGTGNDNIYQAGGDGNDSMVANGGNNDDVIFQMGGAGDDSMNCLGGEGNDNIHQSGGDGNDAIRVSPGYGVDLVYIDGGRGNDSITYDNEFDNTDTVEVDGGEGIDRTAITHYSATEIYRILDVAGSTIYGTGNGGSVITVRNMEFLTDYGNAGEHTNDNVAFTLTFASGSLNSVPTGADRVTISIDTNPDTRVYRLTPELGSASDPLTVSFVAVAGAHKYTAKAWSDSTLLATIGPISFTTVSGFPLTIPLAFSFPAFDSNHTDIGEATPNTFTFFGTEARNRVVQYGGAANDLISSSTAAGNDWSEQYGGDGDDTMNVSAGSGNDYVYQDGGAGRNNLTVLTGDGDDHVAQKGGAGADRINCQPLDGNDSVQIEGGGGDDAIFVSPGAGNDTVAIDAGPENDSITYDLEIIGTDTVSIDGGTGADTLKINRNDVMDYTIKDAAGTVLFSPGSGGTVFTSTSIEEITVLDEAGNIIFTWSAP